MNNKPNIPDEVIPGRNYSFWADMKVNGWLSVAALISGASDILFPHLLRQWPVGWRVTVALLPFLAILLWTRDFARWIRGMDELHQRITLAAIFFAVSATFFFVLLWHRLDKAGLFEAISPTGNNPCCSRDIGTVGHTFLLVIFCYILGYSIFNRRYK